MERPESIAVVVLASWLTFREGARPLPEPWLRFQAIDLRWGVSEEEAADQSTMRICRAEIARCQAVTPRPNFVVLLGDRHGWRPLPD